MSRLFVRFAAIYGHLWSSIYKTEEFISCTKQEWQAGLQSFDNLTLDKALTHCRQHEAYPPSLPMFIDICKAQLRGESSFPKKEETPRGDLEVARMHLDKMRAILNMRPR